jgi:hypothetical protein
MKGDGTVNQGFLLSKKDNERLEAKLKEIGWSKTQFYRELTTKWLDGKVLVQVFFIIATHAIVISPIDRTVDSQLSQHGN